MTQDATETPGDPGGAAGWIDIRCRRLTAASGSATFSLSAAGGAGAHGQPGQPGHDGGDGGNGYDGFIGGFLDTDIVNPVGGANAGRGGSRWPRWGTRSRGPGWVGRAALPGDRVGRGRAAGCACR